VDAKSSLGDAHTGKGCTQKSCARLHPSGRRLDGTAPQRTAPPPPPPPRPPVASDVVVSGKPNDYGSMAVVVKIGGKKALSFSMDPSDKVEDLVEQMSQMMPGKPIDAVVNAISREVGNWRGAGWGEPGCTREKLAAAMAEFAAVATRLKAASLTAPKALATPPALAAPSHAVFHPAAAVAAPAVVAAAAGRCMYGTFALLARARWVTLESSLGDAKSSLGDAKSSLGDAKSSLRDGKSSLGDAKSSLGDAKSSLGDAHTGKACNKMMCTRMHPKGRRLDGTAPQRTAPPPPPVAAAEVKVAEVKAAVAKGAEVKAAEVKAAVAKGAEVKAAEVKAAVGKAAEAKALEVKAEASPSSHRQRTRPGARAAAPPARALPEPEPPLQRITVPCKSCGVVNCEDYDTFVGTPLHAAAVWGDVRAVRSLLDAGAAIDPRSQGDEPPRWNQVTPGA
jgi:hypothetical protein